LPPFSSEPSVFSPVVTTVKIKIHKTEVLYVCETWCLTLWEEHTPKVFENRVLRIFGSEREEMVEVRENA
jgi:hypothetical protein